MEIIRGTTPRIRLCMTDINNRNINLSDFDVVTLTIDDGTHKVDVNKANMTFNPDRTFECYLTQAETLTLKGFEVEIQIRAKKNNNSIASDRVTVALEDILKEGQI